LAFSVDFDGEASAFRAQLVVRARSGLRRIFSHCAGFDESTDLDRWMSEHLQPIATLYVNWIGRTVASIRENAALYEFLLAEMAGPPSHPPPGSSRTVAENLRLRVAAAVRSGRLTLTPEAPTPLGWRLANITHLVGIPLLLLVLTPFLIVIAPFFLIALRHREKIDPEIAPRVTSEEAAPLARIEDGQLTNQFSAIGHLKPGALRRWTLVFVLFLVGYTTRHLYKRGRLARVSTIKFARWVFLDDRRRLFFASNYDGSLDSYMDDFINKVAFGLNGVFSNGAGYPNTRWLVLDGAKDEQKFKYFIRRHELPTEVWYDANPNISAINLRRNELIRAGIENGLNTDAAAQAWLDLL
jgi:hypothetical protein